MEIIHVSAECYPMAKAGGLGDVVGALPKYQNELGHIAKVVMPMYRTKFLYQNDWELVHEGGQALGNDWFKYSVIREKTNKLGFDLYLIDINGKLDRERIYGYDDDTERFISFQLAVCDWLSHWQHKPGVVHCHDHHTGLIPFMMRHAYAFRYQLGNIPTVFTVHNGQYQGQFGWDKYYYIPAYDSWNWGLLDWNNAINPMAAAIKCAWKVTTVSPSYMDELKHSANGLQDLFEYEKGKCIGIINGIDTEVWNPETDSFIVKNYNNELVEKGKDKNKRELAGQFGLDPEKPLITFIGRLVGEKAADLLPDAISQSVYQHQGKANFLILGSGEPWIEEQLDQMNQRFKGYFNSYIGYNEGLSHLMYAGSDFLLMPSRVEPCGLNQLYALRYGTVPVVRNIGGLKDTVVDYGDKGGFGIKMEQSSVGDITYSVGRAIDLYQNKHDLYNNMRGKMMTIDHGWDMSAKQYLQLYESLTPAP
ncbi:glycogen synthase [Niabella ginsenosidivorans]|uniref:Glycogen synthase n=1 Tax=Niabella ginsenosidivorans TaxID=1176587 RepID=A0A1A9I0V9_9BACT|nr:glycogen synthase [Niabella ginsenosidivorans]ANH80351.1 glycogen synthase [Niabella ginsenosidivorans]